jgi:hypothetical protein
VRESRTLGSVRAKAEWLSYSTTTRQSRLLSGRAATADGGAEHSEHFARRERRSIFTPS